jgi:type I restriction enzyme M protein
LTKAYRWESWAAPKNAAGQIDHNKAQTGDDLRDFVNGKLSPYLHGIEAPNVIHTNTLTENLADIPEKDRFDVVLANPPFGGGERKEVQQNSPIRSGETAYLFLQHFIKMLKAGGRAGMVIKNTFLSNGDNASVSLRKMLPTNANSTRWKH